jgi:hypothetical protein
VREEIQVDELPNQMIDMIIAVRDHEGVRLVGGDPKT